MAVEGGKLLLQQLEVQYYQWLLFAIVYSLFKNVQKIDQFIYGLIESVRMMKLTGRRHIQTTRGYCETTCQLHVT